MPAWALDHPRDRHDRTAAPDTGQMDDVSPGTVLGAREGGDRDPGGSERPRAADQRAAGAGILEPATGIRCEYERFLIFSKGSSHTPR